MPLPKEIAELFFKKAEELGVEVKPGVAEAIKAWSEGDVVIFRAPPGYGKSFLSIPLGAAIAQSDTAYSKLIHVIPMTSIVEDIYKRALVYNALHGSERDEAMRKSLSEVEDIAERRGVRHIGYQFWTHSSSFKDELFIRHDVVYTTFDSFLANFTKLTPLKTRYASYEAARANLMKAVVVFDEAHLYTSEGGGETKTFSAFAAVLREYVNTLKSPVMIATATIPDALVETLEQYIGRPEVVTVVPKGCPYRRGRTVEDDVVKRSIHAELTDGEDILKLVEEGLSFERENHKSECKTVLVVANTVGRAVQIYRKLSDKFNNIVLIHGRLNLGDRRAATDKLRDADIVVATQVVEAGVDLCAKALITDVAPLPNLVQRIGRVARRGGRGLVKILKNTAESAKQVYNEEPIDKTLELLRETKVDWADYCPARENSYAALLEKYGEIYRKLEVENAVLDTITSLNRLVSLHREDAQHYASKLCGFARDSVAVPVVTCSVQDCGGFKPCIALLSLDYLNRRREGKRYWEKLLLHNDKFRLVACVNNETKHVELKPDEITRGEMLSCGHIMMLEKIVARKLKESLEEGRARIRLVGFLAREGVYERGHGFSTDL